MNSQIFRRCAERLHRNRVKDIIPGCRGIYALLRKHNAHYDVVYIGAAVGQDGFAKRVVGHERRARSKKKWTHFSIFEVHPKISNSRINELEGLLRHVYRSDCRTNLYNSQRRYGGLLAVRNNRLKDWA